MNAEFPATSWTLVRAASDRGNAQNMALHEFTARYYAAVHGFIRAIVHDDDRAEDLTQEFFTEKVLRTRRVLVYANSGKGRFRVFLKRTIRNFIIDEHRSRQSAATSGMRAHDVANRWDRIDLDAAPAADEALLREWGQSLVQMAITQVEGMCTAKRQQPHFAMFKARYLSDGDRPPSFREVGAMFSLDEKTARERVDTVVRRFRTVLGTLLSDDASVERDVDEEIRRLIALL